MPKQVSNLNDILLLNRITRIGPKELHAESLGLRHSAFTLLECLAQAASYHARFLVNLDRHAFLAEFSDISILREPPESALDIQVAATASSDHAIRYTCSGSHKKIEIVRGNLLIGLRDYDATFSDELLRPHYSRVLRCLQNA